MSQNDKARRFHALHRPRTPLVLYNIWDAGGAQAIARAGAKAIGTSSWSIAAAHGYADGEKIPLALALTIVARIAQSTDLPVTVDIEGRYATSPAQLAEIMTRVIEAGAVSINFEDQIIGGDGLYPLKDQVARISGIRSSADAAGLPLFINARTDVFLKADPKDHADLCASALARLHAYADAGADGLFVPGLTQAHLIRDICARAKRPVNIMLVGDHVSVAQAATAGAARVSAGPGPYGDAMADLAGRSAVL